MKFGVLGEGVETWALGSYAKGYRITRQALINDDIGVFGEIPARMGSAVIRREKNLFWALWTSNPKLADGKEVFPSAHKNVTSSGGGVPSVDEIAKGRLLLRQQTDLAGNYLEMIRLVNTVSRRTMVEKRKERSRGFRSTKARGIVRIFPSMPRALPGRGGWI